MARSETPLGPPWKRGAAPSAEQRNVYEFYLMGEIKNRDMKHDRLAHHVNKHC